MATFLGIVIVVLWLLPFLLWAYLLLSSRRFFAYLRQHHPDAWIAAGRPTQQAVNDKIQSPLPLFLWKHTYRTIQDPELQRLGDKAFLGILGFPLSMLIIVLVFIVAGYRKTLIVN